MRIESNYLYRVIRASWGIHISANGSANIFDSEANLARGEFRFHVEGDCLPGVRKALAFGAALTMSRILQEVNYANVDIIINNIVHSDVDFQTEGAVALAIRLLEKMFNLDESEIDVQFDHDLNRYTFPWDLSKLGSFWLD